MLGILVVNKPKGITSHDVVNRARTALGTRRVGHSGTLDPMATGVLVLAVGPATRFLQYLPLEPKVYEATITFGFTTDTQDAEGEFIEENPVPRDLQAFIRSRVRELTGEIEQVPPMFSALKKDGRAMYDYARAGIEIERAPRRVFIQKVDVRKVTRDKAQVRIVCSGGTYIRTWAHDLGQLVGCGAYLSGLERTAVGKFRIEEARSLDQINEEWILPLRDALEPLPMMECDADLERRVRTGQTVKLPEATNDRILGLLDASGNIFAAARVDHSDKLRPECVIPAEAIYGVV